MCDQHAVYVRGEIYRLLLPTALHSRTAQEMKVRELLLADHVQPAVKHDPSSTNLHYHAAPPDILPRTKRYYLYRHFVFIRTLVLNRGLGF